MMDPIQQLTYWERLVEKANKVSCPAACCRALAELAFKLSKARGMQPAIRETILEGLQQRFQEIYLLASEIFADMGLRMTEAFEVVPLPQVPANTVQVKQEPAGRAAQQAEVKEEIEKDMACVAAALKDVKVESDK